MKSKHDQNMSQNCAEAMLSHAASLVLQKNIHFIYEDHVSDDQVDLSDSFMFSDDNEKQFWYCGTNHNALEEQLLELDITKVYFLRTGTNGGAGHWQTLYFDESTNGWINYSTPTNNYQLTQDAKLSEQGLGLISTHASWGPSQGQYAFLLVEASEMNLINASNFLYDFRVDGYENALENLFKIHDDFYPHLTQTPTLPLSINLVAPTSAETIQSITNEQKFQFNNTFFQTPQTNSEEQLENVEEQFKVLK
jgi:hypothetical protein